uniref:Uncharacterized protein n=1 Tax=Arion vulgaris TaxID=1028688 RepID=A0A0B7A892_9EUPU
MEILISLILCVRLKLNQAKFKLSNIKTAAKKMFIMLLTTRCLQYKRKKKQEET